MRCAECGTRPPLLPDALFCGACGTQLYEAEWRFPAVAYRSVAGRAEAPLTLRTRMTPDPGQALDGPYLSEITGPKGALHKFEPHQHPVLPPELIEVGTELELDFTWHPLSGEREVDKIFAVLERATATGKVKTAVPFDRPLTVVPRPVCELEIVGQRVDESQRPLNLVLKPTTGFWIDCKLRVKNDSLTHIRDVRVTAESGRPASWPSWRVVALDGTPVEEDSRVGPGREIDFKIRLTPETYESLTKGRKETEKEPVLLVRVTCEGVEDPLDFRIAVQHLAIPPLQALVRRATALGRAYVGSMAIRRRDISSRRLDGDSAVGDFSTEDARVLRSDLPLRHAIDSIEGSPPTLRWRVPAGAARRKGLAIDREAVEWRAQDFDDPRFTLTLVVGGSTVALDGVPDGVITRTDGKTRIEVEACLPAYDEPQEGSLTIRYEYGAHSPPPREYRVEVEVFHAEDYELYVGVDYGTTASCVVLQTHDPESPDRLYAQLDAAGLISIGQLAQDGAPASIVSTVVGHDGAEFRPGRRHDIWFENFKLFLACEAIKPRSDRPLPLNPPTASPAALTEKFVYWLLEMTEEFLEEQNSDRTRVRKIAYSVPTGFLPTESDSISRAYEKFLDRHQGGGDLVRVHESFAVFEYWRVRLAPQGLPKRTRPRLILVYDFGGGTTDVTLYLEHLPTKGGRLDYVELASSGGRLGGTHLTNELAKRLFGSEERADLAERLKTRITSFPVDVRLLNDETVDRILRGEEPGKTGEEPVDLAAKKVESAWTEVCSDWLDTQIRLVIRHVLRVGGHRLSHLWKMEAGGEPKEMLVLVAGNSSRLTGFDEMLRRAIKDHLPRFPGSPQLAELVRMPEPKACVAMGAFAVQADDPEIRRVFPEHDYFLALPARSRPDPGSDKRVREVNGKPWIALDGRFPKKEAGELVHRFAAADLGLTGGDPNSKRPMVLEVYADGPLDRKLVASATLRRPRAKDVVVVTIPREGEISIDVGSGS